MAIAARPPAPGAGDPLFSLDLLLNAIVAGLLLGGFYAAVSLGISMAFGLLDIVNIAHPVFVILGSYVAYIMNARFGLDPILTGLLFTPVFYGIGVILYRVYYVSFERKGAESLRGLVFFFGVLFIVEVSLLLVFGVDYQMVEAPYIGRSIASRPRRDRVPAARALRGRRAADGGPVLVPLEDLLRTRRPGRRPGRLRPAG